MKKRTLIYYIISICILLAAVPTNAVKAQEDTQVVRVGYSPGDDLVEDMSNYNREGYGYQVLEKIEETSNFVFEYVEIEGDIFDALDNREVDVIGLFYRTPERLEKYLYLDTPINTATLALMAKEEANIPYDDPASIDGKTVASYPSNAANEFLDEYLRENNISVEYIMEELHEYTDIEADFHLRFSTDANLSGFESVLNLAKMNTYLISNYGNEEMMEELNDALLDVIVNEGTFFAELEEKYYGGEYSAFHRDLTPAELDLLQSKPLTVGYVQTHRPYTFTNEQGEADGAIVDLMDMLSDRYGFEVEYHSYGVSDQESFTGDYDIIISMVGHSDYVAENYTGTQSYHEMPMLSMVPRQSVGENATPNSLRVTSPTIGVMKYHYTDFDKFLLGAVENNIVFYNAFEELLKAYEAGDVDMAVFTQIGTTYANSYLTDGEHYMYATNFGLNFRLSIANDIADEYVPIFNVMLDNVSEMKHNEILIANTATYFHEPTFLDHLGNNWHYYVLGMVAIAGVFISRMMKDHKDKQSALLHAYNTDALTGLTSGPAFHSAVEEVLKDAKPGEYEMISFDIDFFKVINSYYSIERGTQVIKAMGEALKNVFKDVPDVYIMRRDADTFALLRKVNVGGDITDIYSNHICPEVRKVIGEKHNLSMSFGMLIINDPNEKINTLMSYVDTARMQGKTKHGTSFIQFDDAMQKDFDNRLKVTFRMEQALKDREFYVVYQPKINLQNLELSGAEALVRWQPKLGGSPIYPDAFIPVFEENGFIAALDMYVFEEVCKLRSTHKKGKLPLVQISVNLSAHTVLEKRISSTIMQIAERYGVEPKEVEFEVTESAIIGEEKEFLSKVRQLKKLGFSISIDDFGAGVSSLNRLSAIDADILKLDKAFFHVEENESKVATVVHGVIKMAKSLDMKIVAEGVETSDQVSWLRKAGCDYAQGYYFARPMPEDQFLELIEGKTTIDGA